MNARSYRLTTAEHRDSSEPDLYLALRVDPDGRLEEAVDPEHLQRPADIPKGLATLMGDCVGA
ncbi:MAG: hypothetical protein NVSMB6_10820 [Burkholderiaceae bacterium]